MNPILRWFSLILLALSAAALPGQGPGRQPVRHYGREDGLASEVVTSMAQTADGQLWAGTESGLVSFDGEKFFTYGGALPSPVLRDLFAETDGALWVATEAGVVRIMDRKSRLLGAADGLPTGSYAKIGRDGNGHLWVLGFGKLYVENGPLTFVKAPDLPVPERPVQLFTDRSRTETLVLTARHILVWKGSGWELIPGPKVGDKEEFLNLAKDGEEGIWVRSSKAMWQLPRGGSWRKEKANMTGGFSFSSRLDRDSQGWVWFDDADGLWRMKGEHRERYGRPGEDAKGGMVDQEGGIWIRSDHGVQRTLGRSRWAGYDTEEGLATKLVWQPHRDHLGRLWVATDKGLCAATPEGFKVVIPGRICAVVEAPGGALWASGSPGGTVYEVDPKAMTWKTHVVDVLPTGRVTSGLALDDKGEPWVADPFHGLARGTRNGDGWTWRRVFIDGKSPENVFGVQAVPGGGVLVLHDGTGSILRDGVWREVPGLLPEAPAAMAFGPSGKVAFAYRNPYQGFAVVTLHTFGRDGMVRNRIVPVRGPGNDALLSIFSVAIDASGRVWVGTNKGLGVLSGDGDANFQMIGMEDRLISPECNEGSIFAEADRVWLGTTSGLAVYNSSLPPLPPVLKQPLILWARSGQLELEPMGPAPRLPRASNLLELKFMVPTFQAPGKIWYEAKLAGVDPGWIRQDEGHLRYAGLRAGEHTLALRGVLPDWGMEGPPVAIHFTVIPAWWETPWAQALGVLLLAAGIWLMFWLRHLALQARNRQLQAEVARQTKALQEASRAKSAFLANMSHELRTPLNAILLYSELLQEEAKERGLASTIDDAARISQAGSSLLNLIDDILDISKIEAGHMRLDLEDVELVPFLRQLDSALRPVVERKGNLFQVENAGAPSFLHCDSTRLQQILANLLGNAAKFTENGKVSLKVSSEKEFAVFRVEDTGIGMTREEQVKVFSEFVQADSSTTRKYGGTGLGLTLVQRLTEMLGGRVELASEPGTGTCVTVRIPRADVVPGPPAPV